MTKTEAYNRAKFLSKRDGIVIYIVLDSAGETGYDIADDRDMDTFYLGLKPIDAYVGGKLDYVS